VALTGFARARSLADAIAGAVAHARAGLDPVAPTPR
jgi:hypothetical protein